MQPRKSPSEDRSDYRKDIKPNNTNKKEDNEQDRDYFESYRSFDR